MSDFIMNTTASAREARAERLKEDKMYKEAAMKIYRREQLYKKIAVAVWFIVPFVSTTIIFIK